MNAEPEPEPAATHLTAPHPKLVRLSRKREKYIHPSDEMMEDYYRRRMVHFNKRYSLRGQEEKMAEW